MKTLKYILISLFITALTAGCVKEKKYECKPGVYLTYYYELNKHYSNRFENEVDRLDIFVFDNNNKFYQEFVFNNTKRLTNNHRINIPLPKGTWKIATWGGYIDDYIISSLTPGVTTLDELVLSMKEDKNINSKKSKNSAEIGVSRQLNQLFNGEITQVITYEDVDKEAYAKIPLTKDISNININIIGLRYLNPGWNINDFDIETIINNSAYQADNSIHTGNTKITHYTGESIIASDTLKTSHRVMRLMLNDTSAEIIIKSKYLPNGEVVIPLLETILKNPSYKTQQDLDREDTYNFQIELEPQPGNNTVIKVTITINDWEIIYITSGK